MCDDVSAYANSLGSALQSADANTDKLLSQSRGASYVDDSVAVDVSMYILFGSAAPSSVSLVPASAVVANAWFEFGLSFTMLGSFESEQKVQFLLGTRRLSSGNKSI